MKRRINQTLTFVFASLMILASCSKKDHQPANDAKSLLTAHTWQVEEASYTESGQKYVTYKKGAANNDDDYSKVRQTYKADGSVVWVDQSGDSGSDGRYELLNNNQQIKLIYGGTVLTCDIVQLTATTFSYKIPIQDGFAQFIFSPVQ